MATQTRQLSIGEFSAATQLSPKALRLYDEQRLLPPAHIDAANGYRYYGVEQIARGRLIRTLRDMGLTLAAIGIVIGTESTRVESVLVELAREQDKQRAREKRAFQDALMMLRHRGTSEALEITERTLPPTIYAVRPFVATRDELITKFGKESLALQTALKQASMSTTTEPYCALLDPLSEDEARLEVLIPVKSAGTPLGIPTRQFSAAHYASVGVENRRGYAADLTAALDAMFDWFDRRGVHAIDVPLVCFVESGVGLRADILWAYSKTHED
jgi:DNA-binding transcriptional MerR regulator